MNDVGEKIPNWFESARLYYAYTGDASVMQIATGLVDYALAHGTSPSTFAWPNFPYTTTNAGDTEFRGFTDGGRFALHEIQVDHAAEMGLTYYRMYLFTGDAKYLTAARNVADVLASKARTGTATQSVWPYRVVMSTGQITAQYGANWIGAYALLDQLVRADIGNVAAYASARDKARAFILELSDGDRLLDGRAQRHAGQQQHLPEQPEQEQRRALHPRQSRVRSADWQHPHSPAHPVDRDVLRQSHHGRRAGHGVGRQHRRRAGRLQLQDGLPDGALRGRERQVVRGVGRRREQGEGLPLAELGDLHQRRRRARHREPLLPEHRDVVVGLLRRGAADVLPRLRRHPGVGPARRGPHPVLAGRAQERVLCRGTGEVHAHRVRRHRVPAAELPALDGDRRRGRPRAAAGPHHGGLHRA